MGIGRLGPGNCNLANGKGLRPLGNGRSAELSIKRPLPIGIQWESAENRPEIVIWHNTEIGIKLDKQAQIVKTQRARKWQIPVKWL